MNVVSRFMSLHKATEMYPANTKKPHGRDISEYQVNEPAPTEEDVQNIFVQLLALAAKALGTLVILRKYVGKWACWLKLGLSTIKGFEDNVKTLLPSIASC